MTGHCLCGAVRFEARPPRFETHVCHCEMCRRWAGSAFMCVPIPPEAIRFEGVDRIRTYASSDWAERAWCDGCGATLYYRLRTEQYGPRTYEMALGLFDEPDAFPVVKEIFIDRKPTAYALVGDHRRLTGAQAIAAVSLG